MGATNYAVAVVSPEFEKGASFNLFAVNSVMRQHIDNSHYYDTGIRLNETELEEVLRNETFVPRLDETDVHLLQTLQMKALQGQLERKSPDECIGTYETQL